MTPPGVFVDSTGHTTTWFQPQAGPVIPPYTTTIPASSNCVTYASTQLFAAAATDTNVVTSSSSSSATAAPTGNTSGAGASGSGSSSRSGAQSSQTGNNSGAVSVSGAAIPFVIAGLVTTFVTAASMLIL